VPSGPTDQSGVQPRPSLPPQARHEAAARLIGLGLYHEAQSLLSIEEPDDAELGMLSSLLAGDPQAAAKFLGRRMVAQTARPGEVDLVRGCIALVSGRAEEALASTQQVLERMDPTEQDWTLFAVAAAPYDLRSAAGAAALVNETTGPAVLAVRAAARAAGGDINGAHNLLEAAGWNGVGDDPRRRTTDLLKIHGHDTAIQELDAARFHRRSLGESLSRRIGEWRRRRNERDLSCRCASTPVWAGESSRYYVNWHLELEEPLGEDERILSCTRTGMRYLDRPSIPVSVRI
jgi:hypothetical protein